MTDSVNDNGGFSLPAFWYLTELKECERKIEEANQLIDRVDNMSSPDLFAASVSRYSHEISYSRMRIDFINQFGEEYVGEKSDIQAEWKSLVLLPPNKWKEATLKKAGEVIEDSRFKINALKEEYAPFL